MSSSDSQAATHVRFVYDAFISYSRKNSDAADKIERDLQKFPLTRGLKKRLGRPNLDVFRDVNDLTGNRLTPALVQNLEQSRTLVVLCSPEARASPWVNQEISQFARLRDPNKIVPVLIAGVPNNERDSDPVDWAFPDALTDALGEVPLAAADLRQAWKVTSRRTKTAPGSPWIKLVAGIVGVRPDELTERIRKQERRRQLKQMAGVVAVILAVVSAVVVVVRTRHDTDFEQALQQLTVTAKATAATDLQAALLLADTAYRSRAEPQTIEALHAVVTTTPQLEAFYDFGQSVTVVDGTPDTGSLVGGTDSGTVYRLDRANGAKTEVMALNAPIEFLSVSDDGKTIAATGTRYDENSMPEPSHSALWHDGQLTVLPDKRIAAMSPSGHTVAVWLNDDTLEILADGKRSSLVSAGRAAWVEVPSDAEVVATSGDGRFTRATVDGSRTETTQIPMGMSRVGGTLSPDGTRFTYISQRPANEVWDLAGPLEGQAGEAGFAGYTINAQDSDIALSHNGTRMATAADGSIRVSDVQPKGEFPSVTTDLLGAGTSPHSLRFLSDDIIVSASGSSAALWNLANETPLVDARVPAELPGDCGACGPPRVIVSPDAGKAVIANNALPGTTLVDLATGTSRGITVGGTESDTPPAIVWLDANRVFAYAPSGHGWILTGDRLDVIEREFSLPALDSVSRTVLRDDGRVVLLSERGLVLVDPRTGDAAQTGLNAVAVTTDGSYAVNLTSQNDQGSTELEIIDVASGQTVNKLIDGTLLNFVEHTNDKIALLRQVGTSTNAEVLLVDPHDGSQSSVQPLGDFANSTSQVPVSSSDALFVESVEIDMHALRTDLQLNLIEVKSEFRSFNALGVNRAGTALIVASQPAHEVLRAPVSADAWSALACESAGRQLHPGELESIVKSTRGLTPGCSGQDGK